VASLTGSRFFGTEPRETNRPCVCVNLVLRFDSSSPFSLSSLTCNPFEIAFKVIRTLIEQLMERRTIFHTSISFILVLTLTLGEVCVQTL
jgi:hypothetical protein